MSELQRYRVQWNGPKEFVCKPKADGYWTPWHVAEEEITNLRHQLQQAVARVAELEATLYHGNLEREKSQKVMILRKQAEAVEGFLSEIHKSQRQQEEDFEVSISHSLISQHRLEDYAQRLRQQAGELEAEKAGGEQCR